MAEVIKFKTKGKHPIRKLKVAASVGMIAMLISPVVEPLLMAWLGYVPDGAVQEIAKGLAANFELLLALFSFWQARPGADDVPVPEEA